MNLHLYPSTKEWKSLLERPVAKTGSVKKPVRRILAKVKAKGDKAVLRFTRELDAVKLRELEVSPAEIAIAATAVDHSLKEAIARAKQNIERFHLLQRPAEERTDTMPGVHCWRRAAAIEKVGLYIPGGSAPLFSTVLMLAIPAGIAGCKEIILCTPPQKDGSIHPAILYSASLCGVTRIFKCGGAQAIAAMAYGTKSIPKVHKLFGPGNQYVTMAKQLVQLNGPAIDMPAGPSELLVIADDSADPCFVAADLLSQAEHGPDSQVVLVTNSERLAAAVQGELEKQLAALPRQPIAAKAITNSRILVFRQLDEALAFSNAYAPEHLILAVAAAAELAEKVTAAGSVFLGHYSPESAGDYASGTNHTLPTNGYAAMYSGVSVDSFTRKITFQEISKEGLHVIGPTVMTLAEAEGLMAHRNAVSIRLTTNYVI